MENHKLIGGLLEAAGRCLSAGLCEVSDAQAERIFSTLSEFVGDFKKDPGPDPARLLEAFTIQERQLQEARERLAAYESHRAPVVEFKHIRNKKK